MIKAIFLSIFFIILLNYNYGQKRTLKDNVKNKNADFDNSIQIFDKHLIGTISADSVTYLILSGRECENCEAPPSIYVYSKTRNFNADSLKKHIYSFPGKEYIYENFKLVSAIRTFWGDCTKKFQKSIIWYQKDLSSNGKWKISYYVVQLVSNKIKEIRLSQSQINLTEIISNLKKGKCREIKGVDYTNEP